MITAFWHELGIANGIMVPKEVMQIQKFKKGTPREVYLIPREFMQEKLAEYIKWLEQYQKNWDKSTYNDSDKFSEDEPSRLQILKMINLLQIKH